jgi:outer membrane biosynthesis protein TonB
VCPAAVAPRMPTSEAKSTANEPNEPTGPSPDHGLASAPDSGDPTPSDEAKTPEPLLRGAAPSRWVDYDTHELLQMISELEDERRWARLREGIWIALLVHIFLISAITWIPRYVFKVPAVIDPFEAIKKRKDLSYLDLPPDALRTLQPKVTVKPAPEKQPRVDKKTLEAMNKPQPEPPPEPAPEATAPAQPTPPATPPPQPQPSEVPSPVPAPAQPNFAMGSANPADQLRDAMKGASRGAGSSTSTAPSGGGLAMHPGAGSGGVQVLSDTQGVDFNSWLMRWHRETQKTWDPLIPDEVNPPILKKGAVVVRFKVLPNGRLMEGSMVLEGRSGDTGLDRAAWGALTGSNYPPLPKEFHGPYLELRAIFLYNMAPPR